MPSSKPHTLAPLEWEAFVAKFARQTDGGWLVERDLFLTSAQLHAAYVAYVKRSHSSGSHSPGSHSSSSSLLGWDVEGTDEVWSGPQKIALTWCVGWVRPSTNTPDNAELHAERYELLVQAVEESARAWERVTNANFVHLREFDDSTPKSYNGGSCRPGQDGVHFRVRMSLVNECEGPCKGLTNATPRTELEPEWAGPGNPDGFKRELIMSASSLSNESEAITTALHELGHVLGFEHEHYRDEFPDCPALTSSWRELTPADPKSVMAYDSCEGVLSNEPQLSAYDRLGAFYQYNWARRHTLLTSPASPIDDFSYDGTGRTGIAWYDADNASVQLWTSVTPPGQAVSFDVSQLCLDGGTPPCDADTEWSHRVRPSPLFVDGTAANIDILLYGSGELDDVLLKNAGPMFEAESLQADGHKVPVIGAFSSGIDDQVIFHGPGPDPDLLLDPEAGVTVPLEYADYAYPLPGWYRGFGGGGTDILWYQPEDGTIEIWQWLPFGDEFDFLRQGAADVHLLGLQPGIEYVPLLGDFDGDTRTDIFWYAPGAATDPLWLSASNQDVVIFDSFAHQVTGQYNSFVGDFNGDSVHDILWYSVLDEAEGGLSSIWYFDVDGGHSVRTFSIHGDYTPIVADLDGDGCTDIMWYDGTSDSPQSPIWRCVPGELDFQCDTPQPVPARAFPIGYGGSF